MRVVVLGAEGLLGRAVAADLAGRGHEVTAVRPYGGRSAALTAMPSSAAYGRSAGEVVAPEHVPVEGADRSVAMDVVDATETALDAVLHSADAVVHALAVDDRDRPQGPVTAHYQRLLVDPTVRVTRAACRQGVGHVIVLGSAYATFARLHPEWRLAEHHPYIQARIDQGRRARDAAAGSATDVSVLEIPSVFGAKPGAAPVWRAAFLDTLRRGPVALALPGGAAAVTHEDVGIAVSRLVERHLLPGRHAIATDNVTHRRLAQLVVAELGRASHTLVVPGAAAGIRLRGHVRRLQRRGGFGLDPVRVGRDILTRTLFLDTTAHGAALGLTPRPVDDAIRSTVRAAYPQLFDD